MQKISVILYIGIFLVLTHTTGLAQLNAHLKLSHKKKAKTAYLEVGDRVKIMDRLGNETSGRIKAMDSTSISLKKKSIPIAEIYSISKRNPAGVEVFGALCSAAGIFLIMVSNSPGAASVADDQFRLEVSLIGGALVVGGTVLLFRKSYSQRNWIYSVE